MAKNAISRISNAFSTGGGGVNFEQQIQAMFLLSLLVDGFCPAMKEQTKRVCFQAKHLGYDVDDLVVFTERNQSEGKLLCQIKHSVKASEKDKVFQEVICAAWSDFNKANFDKDNDRIALATAQIAVWAQKALRFLHEQALAAVDEADFAERIKLPVYSDGKSSKMLNFIRKCITEATNSNPRNEELWKFCKVFMLLLFDLDCEESVNRALSAALIRNNSEFNAFLVWSRLFEYAGWCNQNAVSVDMDNIDKEILSLFAGKKRIVIPLAPIAEIDMFIPLVALIGAWREDNEHDRRIIKLISGMEYSEFEIKARRMLCQNREYLQLTNGGWIVYHKEEMLSQCKEMLFDDILARVFEAGKYVLSQRRKSVLSQEVYAVSYEKEYDNSQDLRNSLVKSICWLKLTLPELPNCNPDKIKGYMGNLVNDLLKDTDWTIWASLCDCLQYLAEIAPNTFLYAVEWTVLNKKQEILKLFPKSGSGIFTANNYFSSLLWALEILAWSPDYFVRVICVLGLLEDLPYEKTNWTNTPINSIVNILLPWYPQTIADTEKRKNALKSLKNDSPNIFWEVLKKLLPNHIRTASNNPRPQYMNLSIPEKINVSRTEFSACNAFLLELAVETVSNEKEKQVELIDQLGNMNESVLNKYLACIEGNVGKYFEDYSVSIWLKLKEQIVRIKPTKGMPVYKQLNRVQTLIKALEPQDVRMRYQALYLGNRYLFDKEDYAISWKKYEDEKMRAVKEIFAQFGVEETERFGVSVKNLNDVAGKLGQALEVEEVSQVIDAYSLKKVSKDFAVCCIKAFAFAKGADNLLDTSLCQQEEGFVLEIIANIPFSMPLLKVINKLLPDDIEYWKNACMPYMCQEDEPEELKLILKNLITCKRYVTAVNLIGKSNFAKIMDADSIYNLLKLAGTEESIGHETLDNYFTKKIIGWLQNQESISLEARSDIEFIYLPLFDSYSDVQPRALRTRLSLNADYFCSMLEMCFRKRNDSNEDKEKKTELSEGVTERLYKILFPFSVTPGIDWNGVFEPEKFKQWMNSVRVWSEENDRYEVAMSTVGSGLSYAELDEEKLPETVIIEELNRPVNDDLRSGYFLGIINQRGVHYVDPEGKPELDLAEDYTNRANKAEAKGYIRYAGVLRKIADNYTKEAERNIASARNREK